MYYPPTFPPSFELVVISDGVPTAPTTLASELVVQLLTPSFPS
jgi:hypothetical protein